MAIISFASIKGGVGKTSTSINVAHAFARRECRTLIIDTDPTAHATRYFLRTKDFPSPLAELFLRHGAELETEEGLIRCICEDGMNVIEDIRPNLSILPAGPELRHFLWGKGARLFKQHFQSLIEEFSSVFDTIIIDTPPEYNVLTRNAIAASSLVVVPVDSSEMSINSLEELLASASHIEGPRWAIVRTLVTRTASRVRKLQTDDLNSRFDLTETRAEDELHAEDSALSSEEFMELLDERERHRKDLAVDTGDTPIYLLRAAISRTELQNKLSFTGKTAFDLKESRKLASQYNELASELEDALAAISDQVEEQSFSQDMEFSAGLLKGAMS